MLFSAHSVLLPPPPLSLSLSLCLSHIRHWPWLIHVAQCHTDTVLKSISHSSHLVMSSLSCPSSPPPSHSSRPPPNHITYPYLLLTLSAGSTCFHRFSLVVLVGRHRSFPPFAATETLANYLRLSLIDFFVIYLFSKLFFQTH
jgi:hypothetical protein